MMTLWLVYDDCQPYQVPCCVMEDLICGIFIAPVDVTNASVFLREKLRKLNDKDSSVSRALKKGVGVPKLPLIQFSSLPKTYTALDTVLSAASTLPSEYWTSMNYYKILFRFCLLNSGLIWTLYWQISGHNSHFIIQKEIFQNISSTPPW